MGHSKTGVLHFKSKSGYLKYLAHIHIHNESKGHHHPVIIAGRKHEVCHKCGSISHLGHQHTSYLGTTEKRTHSGVRPPNLKHVQSGVKNDRINIRGIPSGYGKGGILRTKGGIKVPKIGLHVKL